MSKLDASLLSSSLFTIHTRLHTVQVMFDSEMEEKLSPASASWKKELQQDLESVQAVGEFACQSTHSQFANPGLEIDGIPISLPLNPHLVDRIKAVARPASFGRNGLDVVSHSPDLIWELVHDQFRIANPSWPSYLESIKQEAAHSLGWALSDVDVEADKLVLYEKGSFVGRRQVSQLNPEVRGCLTVCLPSGHTGGDICLEYAGRHCVFPTALASAFDLSAFAWHSAVTVEVKETYSGYRLELVYSITPRLGTAWSADFLTKQHARLKERLVSWPEDLPKVVHLLDHVYSEEKLNASDMKAHDGLVIKALRAACSEAGIYLFLGNLTKKEYDPNAAKNDHWDDNEVGIYLDYLCTGWGQRIASDITLSPQHLIPADPYSNRSADEVEEGDEGIEEVYEEDSIPNKLKYHDSAVVLIPKNKLHHLLGLTTNIETIMALVINDLKNNPNDATVQADMLELMNRILDSGKYKLAGLAVVEGAWNLKDKLLYRRSIQHCTADGRVPTGLPKLLAKLVAELPAPQVVDWSECLDDLLDCSLNLRVIFATLDNIEQVLDKEPRHVRDSFRTWVAVKKRDRFTSSQYLETADHNTVQELANLLWHDKDWVEKRFIPELECCQNRTLVSKVIESLAVKGSDNTLPGAVEAAKKILGKQLQRLCLGTVNLLSKRDREADDEVQRFIDLVTVCMNFGFKEEALELIERIEPDMEEQLHYPEPRPVPSGALNGLIIADKLMPILAHRLMSKLCNLPDARDAPFVESLRDLFQYLLRKYIFGALSRNGGPYRFLKHSRERYRTILDDDTCRKLHLLEAPPMKHEHANQVVAGIKREAEEELSPPRRSGFCPSVASSGFLS